MLKNLIVLACVGLASQAVLADGQSGKLLVATSYYAGNTAIITPNVTMSGGVVDGFDGSYPNVFQNNVADGSFGVTSPITLEVFETESKRQTGSIDISTRASVHGTNIVTSFSSKSELALNVSQDGRSVTFMGYNAPVNQLDASNANTASVIDPSNAVTPIVPRAIGRIDLFDGSFHVNTINAYSGNNGRAVVLANGRYYMAGNAGNSGKSPKPSNGVLDALSANTGVQMLDPTSATVAGGAYNSTVVGTQICPSCANTGNGNQYGYSITQYGYSADKTGKDDNFRGMTLFDGTLYVTKGSGGNGIDTVFQVGATGALAHGGGIPSDAPITILPGFNTTSEKAIEANSSTPNGLYHPFGIWFANANTLYVADEGDGDISDAATSRYAGLQKWMFDGTKWNLAYTLQNGLNLGQNYVVFGGLKSDGSIDPNGAGYSYMTATDGLRNITGKVNKDGTVTIYAVTSTVSAGTGDQGADPNKLVTIVDNIASTTASQVSGEAFTEVQTAAYGQVLRGVALIEGGKLPDYGHATAAGFVVDED